MEGLEMSTLRAFKAGSHVRVHHFVPGFPLGRRLADLGLAPGEEIAVMRNDSLCPLIVSVKGTRFMLGKSICDSIYAETVSENGATA